MRCFVKRGYAATSLSDIAREAGLSKGGVYFHYKAKEELFGEILDDLTQALRERWTFDSLTEQPADRTMGRLVTAHLGTMQQEPDEVRLLNLLVVMANQSAQMRDRLEQVTHIMRELYARTIAQGIAEGVFIVGDPNTLAISVLAYINGLGAFTVLDGDGRLPVTPEAGAEQVLRMLRSHRSASLVEFAGRGLPRDMN